MGGAKAQQRAFFWWVIMVDWDFWDGLLRKYVNSQGQVDYLAWKSESEQDLTDWLGKISQISLATLSQGQESLAFWLNLYNALTISQVLANYPFSSVWPKILGVPNLFAFFWFFSHPIYCLDNQRYSLNNIENKILRQQFSDPRIHFALVCASVGCPLLRPQAYYPDLLETQLEDDAQLFINNPDKVRYDISSQTLYCSKIFFWYKQDFLQVADSLIEYIQRYYLSPSQLTLSAKIRYLDYDWSLNEQFRAKIQRQ